MKVERKGERSFLVELGAPIRLKTGRPGFFKLFEFEVDGKTYRFQVLGYEINLKPKSIEKI